MRITITILTSRAYHHPLRRMTTTSFTQVFISHDEIAAKVLDTEPNIAAIYMSPNTKDGILAAMTACNTKGTFTVDEAGRVIAFNTQDE